MVAVLLVAMGACSDQPDQVAPSSSDGPAVDVSLRPTVASDGEAKQTSLPPSIAGQLAGTWKAVGEVCDPEFDQRPSKQVAAAVLTLTADGHYQKVEQGDDVRGVFTVLAKQNRLVVTLDNTGMLLHYLLVNGRLENWGEGEAVYPCGTIFERVKRPLTG